MIRSNDLEYWNFNLCIALKYPSQEFNLHFNGQKLVWPHNWEEPVAETFEALITSCELRFHLATW